MESKAAIMILCKTGQATSQPWTGGTVKRQVVLVEGLSLPVSWALRSVLPEGSEGCGGGEWRVPYVSLHGLSRNGLKFEQGTTEAFHAGHRRVVA